MQSMFYTILELPFCFLRTKYASRSLSDEGILMTNNILWNSRSLQFASLTQSLDQQNVFHRIIHDSLTLHYMMSNQKENEIKWKRTLLLYKRYTKPTVTEFPDLRILPIYITCFLSIASNGYFRIVDEIRKKKPRYTLYLLFCLMTINLKYIWTSWFLFL